MNVCKHATVNPHMDGTADCLDCGALIGPCDDCNRRAALTTHTVNWLRWPLYLCPGCMKEYVA